MPGLRRCRAVHSDGLIAPSRRPLDLSSRQIPRFTPDHDQADHGSLALTNNMLVDCSLIRDFSVEAEFSIPATVAICISSNQCAGVASLIAGGRLAVTDAMRAPAA